MAKVAKAMKQDMHDFNRARLRSPKVERPMGDAPAVSEELWLAGCSKDFTAEDAKTILAIVRLLQKHSDRFMVRPENAK